MNMSASTERNRPAPDEPLWLIVQREQRFRSFELPSERHACVVFGSATSSDVKLDGAPPVAFILERHKGEVWLTPGYAGADLRVDTLRLDKPRQLYGRAVVELGDIQLVLGLRDNPPTLRGGMKQFDDTTLSDSGTVHAPGTISEHAETTTFSRSSVSRSDAPLVTSAYTRVELAHIDPSIGDTKEMAPLDFDGWFDAAMLAQSSPQESQSPTAPEVAVVTESSKTEKLDAYAIRMALSGQVQPGTVAKGTPAPIKPEQCPVPVVPCLQRRPSGDTTSYDVAALRLPVGALVPSAGESPQPPSSTAGETLRRLSLVKQPLLARLGLLTQRHPIAVIGGAAAGSLFLVVFMVGAAQLFGGGTKVANVAVLPKAAIRSEAQRQPENAIPSSETPPAPPSVPSTTTTDDGTASVPDPAVAAAAGHLFAGRLVEAENTYRELGARRPDAPSYAKLARVLARRNSADCRSASETKKSCPMVKQ